MNDLLTILGKGWIGELIWGFGIFIGSYTTSARPGLKLAYQILPRRPIAASDTTPTHAVTVEPPISTCIAIWNAGRKRIYDDDISRDNPLRIQFANDTKIIEARIITATRDSNTFRIHASANTPHALLFDFSCLDQQDGAVVEILHTSPNPDPQVLGTLNRMADGPVNYGQSKTIPTSRTPLRALKKLVPYAVFAYGILLLAAHVALSRVASANDWQLHQRSDMFFIPTVFCICGGARYLWITRKRYPSWANQALTIDNE